MMYETYYGCMSMEPGGNPYSKNTTGLDGFKHNVSDDLQRCTESWDRFSLLVSWMNWDSLFLPPSVLDFGKENKFEGWVPPSLENLLR
jgi:hypothetical protein